MAIKPHGSYLLLKEVEQEATASGLYVGTDSSAKIKRGEVVDFGDDVHWPEIHVAYNKLGKNDVRSIPRGDDIVIVHDVTGMTKEEVASLQASIVADVAKGRANRVPKFPVGTIVLYSIFGAEEVRDGNQKFLLVPEKEIRGSITK